MYFFFVACALRRRSPGLAPGHGRASHWRQAATTEDRRTQVPNRWFMLLGGPPQKRDNRKLIGVIGITSKNL